ncbi:hypothetical protein ACSBR2_029259 [Camellia fascicularis]
MVVMLPVEEWVRMRGGKGRRAMFVCDVILHNNNGSSSPKWSIVYRRNLRVWEDELHQDLLSRLQNVAFNRNGSADALFSWKVWAEISIRWGFSWAIPSSLSDLLEWWYSQKSKLQGKLIWEAIPLATLLTLWLARNEKIFNNKDPNWEELGGEH